MLMKHRLPPVLKPAMKVYGLMGPKGQKRNNSDAVWHFPQQPKFVA